MVSHFSRVHTIVADKEATIDARKETGNVGLCAVLGVQVGHLLGRLEVGAHLVLTAARAVVVACG